MSNKEFINNLSATYADVRKLDVKKINLKGKNILEHIKDGKTVVLDERGTNITPYDLWGTRVETAEDGTVTVHHELIDGSDWMGPDEIYTPMIGGSYDNDTIYKVKDNTLYKESISTGEKTVLANIQTNMLKKSMEFSKNLDSFFNAESSLIKSWDSDLSNLIDGTNMFASYQEGLESFNSDLSNLVIGDGMFYRHDGGFNLSAAMNNGVWNIPLPKLKVGTNMFCGHKNMIDFNVDLPNLENGYWMFSGCGFETFSSDLSSLKNGTYMLNKEYHGDDDKNFTSFSSDLSSLTNGHGMFDSCKLDAKSVSNIIQSLQMGGEPDEENTYEITIGIGCNDTEEDRLLFAEECLCDTWQELLDEFSAKNWTVEFQYNGRPTTTYNMRRGESLPVFVKIEEVIMPTEGERLRKPHYTHTSIDGSKYYQMTYFHSTNGSTDGYSQFNSIEEAEQHFEITPKQQIER